MKQTGGEKMAEAEEKVKKKNGRKSYFARVILLLTVLYLIACYSLFQNQIWFHFAEEKALKNEYYAAHAIACRAEDEKSAALRNYISLRIEINKKYSDMLTEYDEKTINEWQKEAKRLTAYSYAFNNGVSQSVSRLSETLELICRLYEEYHGIQDEILEAMDVFGEMNRLYTKDSTGKNRSFTVKEETEKIENWMRINESIGSIAYRIPGYENSYLLNYLITEIRSECEELNAAMRLILSEGYSETDEVRLNGDAKKSFPDIQSSGAKSANVTEKEEYVSMMNEGMDKILVQVLAEFYTVGLNK